MNKERRSRIEAAKVKLTEIEAELELAMQEEQDYFDNMPEGIQGSQKGTDAEAAVDALQEAIDAIQEAEMALENIS